MSRRDAPMFFVNVAAEGSATERLDISGRIISLEYTDSEKKADKAVLKVDNYDMRSLDEPLFKEGSIVQLGWGYEGNTSPTREVVIKKIKGSAQLDIEGNSKSVLLHKQRKTRAFENLSYREIVEQIADDAGFGDEVVFIEDFATSPDRKAVLDTKRDVVTQARMTDAEFLRHLANKFGFEWYVDFDGFHFHPRRIGQKPLRKYVYFTDPGRGDILRPPEIEIDTKGKKGAVRLKGRDPMEKADIDAEANNDTEANARNVNSDTQTVISVEEGQVSIDEVRTRLESLQSDSREYSAQLQQNVASSDVQPTSEASQDDADVVAAGQFRRSQENAVNLKLEVVGDPQVLAKSIIEVQGIGKTHSGNYFVSEVKHKLSHAGYTMTISAKRTGKSSATGRGGGDAGGVATKGKKNTQSADDNDSNELTHEITVKDGQTRVRYVDKKGRDK